MKEYQGRSLLIKPEDLLDKMVTYTAVRLTDPVFLNLMAKKSMNLKFINIVDPTFQKNNLGKSISKINASRIKYGLMTQQRRLSQLYDDAFKAEIKQSGGAELLLKGLLKMFQVTFECIGVSPVLSLLLPQIFPSAKNSKSIYTETFDDMKSYSTSGAAVGSQSDYKETTNMMSQGQYVHQDEAPFMPRFDLPMMVAQPFADYKVSQ